MNSISPVFTEKEIEMEQVIALDQSMYQPMVVLPVLFDGNDLAWAARFQFTKEERELIANGADLIISELVSEQRYTPLHLVICKPGKRPYEE